MYKYYNPNPKYDGKDKGYKQVDCTVRSICAATNLDWRIVYLLLSSTGLKECTMPNDMVVYKKVIEKLGFKSIKKCKKDELKVKDIAALSKKNNAIYLCKTFNHVVCCREGKILDVFNSSEKFVSQYWMKNE